MRKKLKKYNLGGGAPGGSFISGLLDNLNAVPVNGQVLGDHMINNGVGDFGSNIALMAMNQFANSNIPPDLLGQYRRQSLQSSFNGGIGGQFNFMNQFMADNNLPKGPTPINRDPFQFMPQVGFDIQREAEMDASDQSFQFGPLNTAGPQIGMPVTYRQPPAPITGTPSAGLPANPAQTFTMPSIPGASQSQYMLSGPGGIDLSSGALGMVEPSPPPADILTGAGSGVGQTSTASSIGQSILGEANEFDQANAAINKAKGTVSTLKKIVGEDTFKSHAAKLLQKIPGKVGEKIGEKVAASAVEGAGTKFGSFLGSKAGAGASFGVGLLGKGIQELDKKDGNYSRLGAMSGGALQGAAMGSMLGPIGTVAGGLIGAGIGELQRKKFEHNAEMAERTEKTLLAKDNARTRLQSKQILANVPTQGIKDQIYEEGGPVGGGKTPAREKYIPEGNEITLEMLSKYLTDTRSTAENPYDFSAAADTIAYHESGMDPQKHQEPKGPGRGLFQYEEPSALAASNRLRNLAQLWNMPNPEWNTVENTKDFSKLPIDQQKILWMADKLMDKTVDLAALGMGEEPLVDFWADHHWRGSDDVRETRQKSFESHRLPAKMFGLPDFGEEYPQYNNNAEDEVPELELPYNPMIIGGPLLPPTQDTVKIKFDLGGPLKGRPGGFLSSNAPGGFPKEKAFKSYYPPTVAPYNRIDGDTRQQGFVKGYNSGLKEILQLIRLSPQGKPRKIIGLPTGRHYIDQKFHGVRDVYKNNEFDRHYNLTQNVDRDDYEKTFDKYKGLTKMTPEGGRSKTVELGGEDLNWFERRFPGLFTERYKVKSKYSPEGELLKRVTTSRAGGREVKEYPTQAELDAMIAADIQAVQTGTKPEYALGGDTDPIKLVTSPKDPPKDLPYWGPNQEATRQDSLDAYNAAIQLEQGLIDRNYQEKTSGVSDLEIYKGRDENGGSIYEDVDEMTYLADHMRKARGEYTEQEKSEYEEYNTGGTIDEYFGVFEPQREGNTTRIREITSGVVNPDLPLGYYHTGIKPQGVKEYWGESNWILLPENEGGWKRAEEPLSDIVQVPYYDPIAIKPYDLLTEEEKQERKDKYGPEPWMQSSPPNKTYINKTLTANPLDAVGFGGEDPIKPSAPAPKEQEPVKEVAPPPAPKKKEEPAKQNVKPEPVYIFNAANTGGKGSTRTGQVPRAKRVWDDKRKQWKEVPLTQEEIDAYKAKYSFALGGDTPSRTQGGGRLDEAMRLIKEHNMKDDSTFENIIEMIDPTGISAWDDAYRAYTSMKARGSSIPNFDEGLDMLGAIPVMGKAKAAINLYKRSSKPIQYGLTQAYNKFLRHTGRGASILDGIEDETGFLDRKQYGGNTDKFDYIAEGGEVIVHKPGDVPDTDHNGYLTPLGPNVKMINGDKHSAPSGGVQMGQEEDAFIYSDKLKVSKEMQKKIYGSNGKLRF